MFSLIPAGTIIILLYYYGCFALQQMRGGDVDSNYDYDFTVYFQHDSLKSYWQAGSAGCTAFIISPTFLVTAAHCIDKYNILLDPVILHVADPWTELTYENMYAINRAIIHPKYKSFSLFGRDSLRYDIGLLELEVPLRRLPKKRLILSDLSNRGVVTAFGYGGADGGLKYADFTVKRFEECKSAMRGVRTWDRRDIICINVTPSKTLIPGDSGGPLVINKDTDTPEVVGIGSFGHFSVAVYTRISCVKSFIDRYATGHTWASDVVLQRMEDSASGIDKPIRYRTSQERRIDRLKPMAAIGIMATVGATLGGLLAVLGGWIASFFSGNVAQSSQIQ